MREIFEDLYLKITLRRMVSNKKRSLFLIIGIMLATIALVSIGILYRSYSSSLKSLNKEYNGDYHVIYKEINEEKEDVIKNNPLVEKYQINREKNTIKVVLRDDVDIQESLYSLNNSVGKPYEENVFFMKEDSDNIRFIGIVATMYGVAIIISTIIIFNIMIISLLDMEEEIRQLRIVGITPRQVGRLLYNEAFIGVIIAVPLGIAISSLMLFGNFIPGLQVKFDFLILIISIALIIVTVAIPVIVLVLNMNRIRALKHRGLELKSYDVFSNIRTKSIEKVLANRYMTGNFKRSFMTFFMISLGIAMYLTVDLVGVNYINPKLMDTSDHHIEIFYNGDYDTSIYYPDRVRADDLVNRINDNEAINYIYYKYSTMDTKKWIGYWNKDQLNKAEYFNVKIIDNTSDNYYKERIEGFDYKKLVEEKGIVFIDVNDRRRDLKKLYLSEYIPGVPLDVAIDISRDKMKNSLKEMKVSKVVSDKKLSDGGIDTLIIPIENLPYKMLKSVSYQEDGISLKADEVNIIRINTINIKLKDKYSNDNLNKLRMQLSKEVPESYTINDYEKTNDYQIKKSYIVNIGGYGLSVIVILIGVFNIINTITLNIYASEREILLLRAIGCSFKELKKWFVYEGLKYGIYGFVYGCIFSILMSGIFSRNFAGGFGEIRTTLVKCIILFIVVEMICYISARIAMNKIGKLNNMEGIRDYDRG